MGSMWLAKLEMSLDGPASVCGIFLVTQVFDSIHSRNELKT